MARGIHQAKHGFCILADSNATALQESSFRSADLIMVLGTKFSKSDLAGLPATISTEVSFKNFPSCRSTTLLWG